MFDVVVPALSSSSLKASVCHLFSPISMSSKLLKFITFLPLPFGVNLSKFLLFSGESEASPSIRPLVASNSYTSSRFKSIAFLILSAILSSNSFNVKKFSIPNSLAINSESPVCFIIFDLISVSYTHLRAHETS